MDCHGLRRYQCKCAGQAPGCDVCIVTPELIASIEGFIAQIHDVAKKPHLSKQVICMIENVDKRTQENLHWAREHPFDYEDVNREWATCMEFFDEVLDAIRQLPSKYERPPPRTYPMVSIIFICNNNTNYYPIAALEKPTGCRRSTTSPSTHTGCISYPLRCSQGSP